MSAEFPLEREDEERYLVSLLLPTTTRTYLDEALSTVAPDDFGSARYGGLWAAARRLRANDKPINRRNLIAECVGEAGGHSVRHLLDQLTIEVPTGGEDFGHAVNTVIAAGRNRRLVEVLGRATQRAYSADDFIGAYSVVMEELEKVASEETDSDEVQHVGDIVAALKGQYESAAGNRSILSPWMEFNEHAAGGWHRGRLHVIGGRPGAGKSILGHQAAAYAAERGHSALIFSMEMASEEVGGRLLSSGANIHMGQIARQRLDEDSWLRYEEFSTRVRGWRLGVVDKPNLTIDTIVSICRDENRRAGLDLVTVDYLQLLSMAGKQSREQQVSEIARRFKMLARELDCAVLLPCQLNRETERRSKPSMADLRESGGIEAHADLVALLARQTDAKGDATGVLNLDIAKNRFGATMTLELSWRGEFASIG